MVSSWRHFHSYLYTCTLKDHLATKQIITQNRRIRNTVVACTLAWNWRTNACVVLSIEQGTWKNWGRTLSIWMYLNEWMNEWISEVFSMLFEFLDLWIPYVFRQGELALSPIHRKVWLGVWVDAWVSDSSANTASVANTCVNGPCMLPCEDRLLQLCDGKPQLKHAPAAKKWHKQVIKNIKNVTRCRDSRTAKSKETR